MRKISKCGGVKPRPVPPLKEQMPKKADKKKNGK